MEYLYEVNDKIRFKTKGKELTGVIHGTKEDQIKQQPLYMVWVDDKYGWIPERVIIKKY